MQYRVDKRSGNKLSVLGFGCMRFPGTLGKVDISKTEKLILDALRDGINYFDTAYLYPGSEDALGQIVEKNNIRDKIYIATKLPFSQCKSYEDFDKFFEKQLKRLRTDYVDYYIIHAIGEKKQWDTLCAMGIEKWIAEKKKSGAIRQIGYSFHGTQGEFLSLLDAYDWDFTQIQYNYVNINYQAGETGLKAAAKKGIPVIIMEPLLGGKLATGLPAEAQKVLKEQNSTDSPAVWALRWLWNQPEVTVILSGMNAPDQVTENIRTANEAQPGMLSQDEQRAFDRVIDIFSKSYKIPCTGCNYCMPCPKGINIPACFSAYNSTYSIDRFTGMQQYVMSTGGIGTKNPPYASTCVKCGKCESHCPQHIKIRDSLDQVSRRMEPFWYKPAMALVGKIMGK